MVEMAVPFVWWRGGFGALLLGIGWAWFVDFAAVFRAAARVPFLASPRKGTKRRGTLTPGPAGFPALLSRSGRLRNSALRASDSPRRMPPARLALLGGGGRGWKTGGVANAIASVGSGRFSLVGYAVSDFWLRFGCANGKFLYV